MNSENRPPNKVTQNTAEKPVRTQGLPSISLVNRIIRTIGAIVMCDELVDRLQLLRTFFFLGGRYRQ